MLAQQQTVNCHCLSEALQAIRLYHRQIRLSKGQLLYCGFGETADEAAGQGPLDHADIALMDCNTPIELSLDGVFINRSLLLMHLMQPIYAARPDLETTYRLWWNKGVLDDDHDVRKSTALELIPALEGTVPYPDVAKEILLGTRAIRHSQKDMVALLDEIRSELKVPLAMLTSVYRYLPDGRPLAWPPGHLELTRGAAQELDVPLFDTVALVQKHGVATAMNDEMTIYREEFHLTAGEAIFDFIEEVMRERTVVKARNYPVEVIQESLTRHARDLESIAGMEWLARVVDLCRNEASSVPRPIEHAETVPEYSYPH